MNFMHVLLIFIEKAPQKVNGYSKFEEPEIKKDVDCLVSIIFIHVF